MAKDLHGILGIPDNWASLITTEQDAVSFLTRIFEAKGIFICFDSIVGNNSTRPIPVQLCRGFCIPDDYASYIFVNSADAKCAQVFTLLDSVE